MSPNTRITGGITKGRRVTNSTRGRRRGTRSRTQNAVGTMSPMLTIVVMIPTTNEYVRVLKNWGSLSVFVYAARNGWAWSENSRVDQSGVRKYVTPSTNTTHQMSPLNRQRRRLGGGGGASPSVRRSAVIVAAIAGFRLLIGASARIDAAGSCRARSRPT